MSKMTALLLIVIAGAYSNFYASKELLKGGRIDYYIQNNVNPTNKLYNSQPYIRSYNLCKIINLFTILDFY